jgi:mxaL protein
MIATAAARFGDWRIRGLLLALLLLALALARPSIPLPQDFFRFVLVFDLTQSMNVEDAGGAGSQANRLSHAKRAARAALRAMPCESSAGLGIFTGHRSFLLFSPVEVCRHWEEIDAMLDRLDWRMGWAAKSEVAKGLYSGLEIAKGLGKDTVLVFFTDGHEAPPINENFRPLYDGLPGEVRGVLVGVGGKRLVPIPKYDTSGRQNGYWAANDVMQVDPFTLGRPGSVENESMSGVDRAELVQRVLRGNEHLSSLREAYLKRLAGELRLRYHRLESERGLRKLLLKSELAVRRVAETDLGWVAASLALLALVCTYLVPSHLRRSPRISKK